MSNKVAIVTGASKGIGKAIAEKLASQHIHLVLSSRSKSDLLDQKQGLEEKYGITCRIYPFDLGQKDQVIQFANEILRDFNQIDILVNNVGVFLPGASTHEEDDTILEVQMNVNLMSGYYLTKRIIPVMKQQKSGHIFNMCSVASIQAYPSGGSYCISKFAQYGMTKVLREEMKPFGIKVSAILPGATYTSSWEGSDLPENRLIKPEDVAESLWSAYALSSRAVVEEIIVRPQLGDI